MTRVVCLHEEIPPDENQRDMIEVLETVINEIKSGRTVAFGIATVTVDNACATRWMARNHMIAALGAVARLQWEMASAP